MDFSLNTLHDWNLDISKAAALQQELAAKLSLKWNGGPIRLVAGVDGSYKRFSPLMWVAIVLWDISSSNMVECVVLKGEAKFPYVPGYLTFREGPLVLQAFERLQQRPDAVLFDGQGIAHPRGFGLASHLGLWLDLPSVGVAKSRLCGDYAAVPDKPGSWTPLTTPERGTVGAVLCSKAGCRPLFISPGHRIDLQHSIELVMNCLRGYRLPEPTRLAHIAVNNARRTK